MNNGFWDYKFAKRLQGSIHGWGQGWLPVEPEAGISPSKGHCKAMEEVFSAGTSGVHRVYPLVYELADIPSSFQKVFR